MRLSQLFGKTLRQAPAEAETPSHQLLLRAGMVQPLAAGIYCYLPLAWRALRKIEQIIREEMDACGGQEISMPVLQPVELWEASGRRRAFGPTLFTLRDRRERELVLGPTHEEVIVDLFKSHVQSYRDLPLLLYQIQTKFRDEARPRGGLIRVREFTMKDLYSFDASEEGLEESYQKMAQAYRRIFDRCGLPTVMVESDSGAIGGKVAHEFLYLTELGEDRALLCQSCGYAANAERASFQKRPLSPEEPRPLTEVSTPGVKTIQELCAFLGVPPEGTLKAVFYAADGRTAFVAIRGDLEVNEVKLRNALHAQDLRLLGEAEVRQAGLVAGSASPVGLRGVKVVADDSAPVSPNLVGGANRPDFHLRNLNYSRDWQADIVADIALARDGDPCPRCGSPLAGYRGIEMGNIFKLGTVYSEKLGAHFLDRDGTLKPAIMGCYGIGSGRLLAAVIEARHDDKGIMWPKSVAPYQVHLLALGMQAVAVPSAERLYAELLEAGIEVLYDDREESPGVKFNDADLLGMPLRVTVSQRTLKQQSAELKPRAGEEAWLVPLAEAVAAIREALARLP
ncbi:MAG TPA: proline--tRNA ligase [Dehalococcoidia bacterium]|nr:proline--tRNA ligase [Dehalococcoidia bacterium]HLB29005.1 proline--tRNA ligase [Dehalococcoidia bacterium]